MTGKCSKSHGNEDGSILFLWAIIPLHLYSVRGQREILSLETAADRVIVLLFLTKKSHLMILIFSYLWS